MQWHGKHVLVVGMEKSGIASAELLLEKGAAVSAADQKALGTLSGHARDLAERGVKFRLQGDGGFDGFDAVVLSPGVPADIPELAPARANGIPVMGDVELAVEFLRGPVIGITGSNGKTTTTALTGHILHESGIRAQVGGNIGTPVAAMVATSDPDQWNVLELSSFQLETTFTFRPDIAVILNVTQNHLDRHYTMERYTDAKARILDQQLASDFAILNGGDPVCRSLAARGAAQKLWFASDGSSDADLTVCEGMLQEGPNPVIATAEVPIRGRHNWENALAAIGAAHLAGAELDPIACAIRTFQPVEHRLEFVRELSGVRFYNDSKATSVDAALKALSAFDHGLWVVLGGKDKGSDYAPLRDSLHERAKAALLIGAAAEKIAHSLEGSVELVDAGTLENAVRTAFHRAEPGDTILLAPACSSFDQFQSYEHRGRVFKEIVNSLASGEYGTAA